MELLRSVCAYCIGLASDSWTVSFHLLSCLDMLLLQPYYLSPCCFGLRPQAGLFTHVYFRHTYLISHLEANAYENINGRKKQERLSQSLFRGTILEIF